MTCSEVGAVVGFPNLGGGQIEAQVLPWEQEDLATFEQVGAEKAAEEKQSEASVVLEEQMSLKHK
jgi:hypothetical protein